MGLLDTVFLSTTVILLLLSLAITPISFQAPSFFLQLGAMASALAVLLVPRAGAP